jgi:hypothetical protein
MDSIFSCPELGPFYSKIIEVILNFRSELSGNFGPGSDWKIHHYFSLTQKVLRKWFVFLRIALRMVKRCDRELYLLLNWSEESISDVNSELTNENVLKIVHDFHMSEMFSPSCGIVLSLTTSWLKALTRDGQSANYFNCIARSKYHYPTQSLPQSIQLPDAYAKLHALVTSRCCFEYPAVCYVCGEILDAGGKGKCTEHTAKCCGEGGVFFLVQVRYCVIELLRVRSP